MREVFEMLSKKIRDDACEKFRHSVDSVLSESYASDSSEGASKVTRVTRAAAEQVRDAGGHLMEALTDVHIAEGLRDLDARADDLRAMYARELSALAEQLTRSRDARLAELVDPSEERAFLPNFNSAIQKMEGDAEKKIARLIDDARKAKRLNGASSKLNWD